MLLIFKIVILCVFAIHCYECHYEYQVHFHTHDQGCKKEPDKSQYVLAKGANGQTIQANFFFAYEYCRSLGLKLATPDTKEKNDALLVFIKDIGTVWTSGNDLAENGKFVWMTKGSRFSFTDWNPRQPDNAGGIENCVEIRKQYNWKWNNNQCNVKNHVVCQREPTQPAQSIKC